MIIILEFSQKLYSYKKLKIEYLDLLNKINMINIEKKKFYF